MNETTEHGNASPSEDQLYEDGYQDGRAGRAKALWITSNSAVSKAAKAIYLEGYELGSFDRKENEEGRTS